MYISVKRIGKNKRPYMYLQHSVRVGKKVKTRSQYLGPLAMTNAGAHVGLKVLFNKADREAFLKSFPEILAEQQAREAARTAADNAPVFIGGLQVGEFRQETFDNEAMSQK